MLGAERVLGGITSQGATTLGVGHVRHAGFGPTSLAEAAGGLSDARRDDRRDAGPAPA